MHSPQFLEWRHLVTALMDAAVTKLVGLSAAYIYKHSPIILAVEPVLAGEQSTLVVASGLFFSGRVVTASGDS